SNHDGAAVAGGCPYAGAGRPSTATAGHHLDPSLQGTARAGARAHRGLRLRRSGLSLAERRGQGHHRQPLQWLPFFPQHPQQHEGDPMNRPHKKAAATLPLVRCAIYTRKSTEEGLEQEFNSLDAQRESAQAFIRSQAQEGWTCLPDRYDDGGFTGGNMERPALQRLLVDIRAGQIDSVVTYNVDRLSRSLLDFAKMMEPFEQHGVSFVSITQQFNSATSMGRLVLNVLLSFAQFEREIIAERTRDKMAATRRKGKWSGGTPVLGYDLDPRGRRLHS